MLDETSFSKKNEIIKITDELKAHYYKNEFFVDPDKKFLSLMQKITKFFEEDDLILTIKQLDIYREKYEQAVAYIKSMQKENEKELEKRQQTSAEGLDANLNALCQNLLLNKRDSLAFYEAIDSPLGKIVEMNKTPNQNSAESKVNEFNIADNPETNEAEGDLENKFNFSTNPTSLETDELNKKNESNLGIRNNFSITENHLIANQDNLITKAYKARKMQMLDKLKEEYHILVEDKKNLENKITELTQKEKEFAEISKTNENLNLQLEIANEKIKCLTEENKSILERNNKITFENYEITNTNNQLKESLKYLEKERMLNKNKINSNFNKVKLYEKENNASKKKLNSLNTNLRNLTDKLNASVQEKSILEKQMEDLKQEYENKITNLMLEQQKIIKDSFLTTLNSLEEKKIPLEFFYEEEKNALTIMLEDIVISEFTNLKISKIDKDGKVEEIKVSEDLSPRKVIPVDRKKLNNSNSNSVRLEKNDTIRSPSNRSSMMNINDKNIFNNNQNISNSNHKNSKIDLENLMSLNKILSGSSKKSFTNTNTKRILMSNFSSAKKISAFHEENNNNVCTAFYNSTTPSEAMNTQINHFTLNKSQIHNGFNDFQNMSNFTTNPNNNFTSVNFNSNMKVIPEEIDPKISLSSIKDGVNLNDAYIQNSSCSKVFNITINKNYGENNTSHYENDRYSGLNFSAKKKSRVSNFMSGKKNINNNFDLNENDENTNPNIQSNLHYENSMIRKSNTKVNVNCSIISNANNTIVEESGSKNENLKLNGVGSNKKLNGRGNNLSIVGKKALNNNNFEKCIKNIYINTEQINNINKDDIKKIINTASSTRHRKMISLDEALNLEEICDKESLNHEAEVNPGSYNSKNYHESNTNSNGFNFFPTQRNEKIKGRHFNFNSQHVESYLNKASLLEENIAHSGELRELEKPQLEGPEKEKVSKKIEFDSEENLQITGRIKKEINMIENVLTDFAIVPPVKIEEKIIEIIPSTNTTRSFMIDSNVNLITINSFKKSENILITSHNKFDIISLKNQKFETEKLQLSQNERIIISQISKPISTKEKDDKKQGEKKKLEIITEANFGLKDDKKDLSEKTSQEDDMKNKHRSFVDKNLETVNVISLNLDDFKFSHEPNFFKDINSKKIVESLTKKENIQSEFLKTENLLTENLISENYKSELESKTIVSSNKSISESLADLDDSYKTGANLKLGVENMDKDSIMIINDQNKHANESSINRKRRIAHYMKKHEISDNTKVKRLFKKREENEEEKGRCSRCQIL